MKGNPKVGTARKLRFVVETRNAIEFADEGMPVGLFNLG
jgi:hypothetical protein